MYFVCEDKTHCASVYYLLSNIFSSLCKNNLSFCTISTIQIATLFVFWCKCNSSIYFFHSKMLDEFIYLQINDASCENIHCVRNYTLTFEIHKVFHTNKYQFSWISRKYCLFKTIFKVRGFLAFNKWWSLTYVLKPMYLREKKQFFSIDLRFIPFSEIDQIETNRVSLHTIIGRPQAVKCINSIPFFNEENYYVRWASWIFTLFT